MNAILFYEAYMSASCLFKWFKVNLKVDLDLKAILGVTKKFLAETASDNLCYRIKLKISRILLMQPCPFFIFPFMIFLWAI